MGFVQLVVIIKSFVLFELFVSVCMSVYIQPGVCSSGNICLVFLRRTLSLAWYFSSRLGWVSSEPWGLPGVYLPTAGIINTARFFLTQWILGVEFGFSGLQGKLFPN